ncbi:hypothetical protein H8356DRAFT_1333690 [Neocallimastix lanati (nom. inval.)]|nr:hypothetical protein H8356DRAFT_1333690 [Neocallimastix sp. JGI-2020a]
MVFSFRGIDPANLACLTAFSALTLLLIVLIYTILNLNITDRSLFIGFYPILKSVCIKYSTYVESNKIILPLDNNKIEKEIKGNKAVSSLATPSQQFTSVTSQIRLSHPYLQFYHRPPPCRHYITLNGYICYDHNGRWVLIMCV